MDQSVGERLAQGPLRVIRYAHAQQTHHDLLLAVADADAGFDLLHRAEERPAKEVVDFHGQAVQPLKRYLAIGHKAAQRLLFAKEQQRREPHAAHGAVGIHNAQRLGELEIRQLEQAFVATAAPLADVAAKALDLQRIEIVPAGAVDDLRRRVEEAAIGLHGRHVEDIHGQAGRTAIPADSTAQEPAVGCGDRLAHAGHFYCQHLQAVKLDELHARP